MLEIFLNKRKLSLDWRKILESREAVLLSNVSEKCRKRERERDRENVRVDHGKRERGRKYSRSSVSSQEPPTPPAHSCGKMIAAH